MKQFILILLLTVFSLKSYALDFNHSYPLLDKVYEIGTKYGSKDKDFYLKYNYYELKKNKVLIDSFFNYIKFIKIQDYKLFSKKQKISFLVNLYNVYMMNSILERMPIERFQELSSMANAFYFRKDLEFLGGKISLADLEEKIVFLSEDNKTLFYLYKGTYSSPYIEQPLVADSFDNLIDSNLKSFVEKNYKHYPSIKTLYISRIFSFYFDKDKKKQSFKEYVSDLTGVKVKEIDHIKYYQYNWDINSYWLN